MKTTWKIAVLFATLLCACTNGHSTMKTLFESIPKESKNGKLSETDTPGPPLTPDDFKTGSSLSDSSGFAKVNEDGEGDPLSAPGMFEGDIDGLTDDIYQEIVDNAALGNDSSIARNAIKDESKKWPSGVIPYVISSSYNSRERGIIARAFSKFHSNTCVKFIPRSNEQDYIYILKGSGCSSSVGRIGGRQTVSLSHGCVYTGIVIHELMHASGFWHEQSRTDRDSYINIHWHNIMPSMKHNFLKYSASEISHLGASYDTCSVMHYGPSAFAMNPGDTTISAKFKTGCELGQRVGFSETDIQKINALYRCSNKATTEAPTTIKTESDCEDHNKFCATWAAQGECQKNPDWMLKYCQISCKECKNTCADYDPKCESWAKSGECKDNNSYMSLYCLKSCGLCEGTCEDENSHCSNWSQKGYCKSGGFKGYMKLRCKRSCGLC